MDATYQLFLEAFMNDNDEIKDEYEQKMYFHSLQHLFKTLATFRPSPSIWGKSFEKNISDIKQYNISGPGGLFAMANRTILQVSLKHRLVSWKDNPIIYKSPQRSKVKLQEILAVANREKKTVEYIVVEIISNETEEISGCLLDVASERKYGLYKFKKESEGIVVVERKNILYACISKGSYLSIFYGGSLQLKHRY